MKLCYPFLLGLAVGRTNMNFQDVAPGRNRIFINLHRLWEPKWFERKESKIGIGKMNPQRSFRRVPSGKTKFLKACHKEVFLINFFFSNPGKAEKRISKQRRAPPCLQCSTGMRGSPGKTRGRTTAPLPPSTPCRAQWLCKTKPLLRRRRIILVMC